jgi:hypothetical protein
VKTKAQAMRDAGRVIGEALAVIATLTPREAAERAWVAGGPSLEALIAHAEASGLCRKEPAALAA